MHSGALICEVHIVIMVVRNEEELKLYAYI